MKRENKEDKGFTWKLNLNHPAKRHKEINIKELYQTKQKHIFGVTKNTKPV
jgi:hypothetical protein